MAGLNSQIQRPGSSGSRRERGPAPAHQWPKLSQWDSRQGGGGEGEKREPKTAVLGAEHQCLTAGQEIGGIYRIATHPDPRQEAGTGEKDGTWGQEGDEIRDTQRGERQV